MTITSISDLLNAQGHFPRQRFVEYFSGKGGTSIPSSIWTFTDFQGTNTSAMDDSIDGGFIITTGTTAGDRRAISFNGIQQFSPTSSVFYWTAKNSLATDLLNQVGASDSTSLANDGLAIVSDDDVNSNFLFETKNTTSTSTDTTIAIDTTWRDFKMECKSTTCEGSIDQVLRATNTGTLPDVGLNPFAFCRADTTTAISLSLRYLECYNK